MAHKVGGCSISGNVTQKKRINEIATISEEFNTQEKIIEEGLRLFAQSHPEIMEKVKKYLKIVGD